MSWIDKILPSISIAPKDAKKSTVPEGTWKQCPRCDAMLYKKSLSENFDVCPKCEHHLRITARRRIELFLDAGDQIELNADMEPVDLLKFKDRKKYKIGLARHKKVRARKMPLSS